eukprot:UN02944
MFTTLGFQNISHPKYKRLHRKIETEEKNKTKIITIPKHHNIQDSNRFHDSSDEDQSIQLEPVFPDVLLSNSISSMV